MSVHINIKVQVEYTNSNKFCGPLNRSAFDIIFAAMVGGDMALDDDLWGNLIQS